MLSFTAFAVLHMHVASGEATWMPFDHPLTPAQVAMLHGEAGRPAAPNPVPRTAIRPDDASLVAELACDGRAGVVALARAAGWPQSRASARLAELLASGAVHVSTDLSPGLFGVPRHRLPLRRLKQAGTRVRDGRLSMT